MSWFILWVIITVRYFAVGLIFWWLFYQPRKFKASIRHLFGTPADHKQQLFEIRYSLLSTLIFTAVGGLLLHLWQAGWTQVGAWQTPQGWGITMLLPQAMVLILVHDTYFYWTHRWLHQRRWFKAFHYVHHISKKTTPWSSFSFHPIESFINALILPLMLILIPTHPYVVLWHLTLMTVTGVTNHLGFEIWPRLFFSHSGAKYWISAIHHGHHHLQPQYNFGLFLTLWDHLMGTQSPEANLRMQALAQKTHIR